jgi:hypothetical protein
MRKVVHIDCDGTGSRSIANLIPDPIQSFSCPDAKSTEGIIYGLVRKQIPAEATIWDTVSGLSEKTLQTIVIGTTTSIWDGRKTLKAEFDQYGQNARVLNQYATLLRDPSMPPSIFIIHERDTGQLRAREDPLSGGDRIAPNLQRAILSNIAGPPDAIVRLFPAPQPFQWDGVAYPAGTRVLGLSPTADYTAGCRTVMDRPVPPIMVVAEGDPYAFVRFIHLLGYLPQNTLVYGPPKIGKTTFAAGIHLL